MTDKVIELVHIQLSTPHESKSQLKIKSVQMRNFGILKAQGKSDRTLAKNHPDCQRGRIAQENNSM